MYFIEVMTVVKKLEDKKQKFNQTGTTFPKKHFMKWV